MRHLDLFSGIGGFALACRMVGGIETVGFVEIEPYAQAVLRKNFPGVLIHDDIKTFNGDEYGKVDLITGGFPCQPYSVAGKQRGSADNRALWPEMLRVIRRAKPAWVIGENVAGIIRMELDRVLSDLEEAGYTVRAFTIPALAVDAPHQRKRVWIVAYSESQQDKRREFGWIQSCLTGSGEDLADTNSSGLKECHTPALSKRSGQYSGFANAGWCEWPVEPELGRVADGIPCRVDRLRGLGNAIVPQVASEILKGIQRYQKD